ncbi:hypothetical protein H4R19_000817 [Coemansia spiralis]|nr:hypothetical protein H4R19_000817 [Coemansia spiralis]
MGSPRYTRPLRPSVLGALLLRASGSVWALPQQQIQSSQTSTSTTSGTNNNSNFSGPNTVQVYYSLAIGAFVTGVLAFVVTYLCRRRQHQRRSARMAAAGEGTYGLYNGQGPGLGQALPPHLRRHATPIVLTAEQFDMLPQITAKGASRPAGAAPADTEAEAEQCSICLCDMAVGDTAVLLVPCNHTFHVDCARQWLTQRSTLCPLCKADMCDGLGIKPPNPAATTPDSDIVSRVMRRDANERHSIELTTIDPTAARNPATTITVTTIPPR